VGSHKYPVIHDLNICKSEFFTALEISALKPVEIVYTPESIKKFSSYIVIILASYIIGTVIAQVNPSYLKHSGGIPQ